LYILQGIIATCVGCSGIFSSHSIANLLLRWQWKILTRDQCFYQIMTKGWWLTSSTVVWNIGDIFVRIDAFCMALSNSCCKLW